MVNPRTVNVLLEAPVHGAEVDTWDVPVNADWTALDGLIGGTSIIGVTGGTSTLTKPAATAVPAPGPYQSQNRVLRFTGALGSNQTVTIPIAGKWVIDNQTTGAFNLIFEALNAGKAVSVPQGAQMSIYNDGTDCFFADLGKPGDMEFWAGLSAMPSWVAACDTKPYLLADGTIYNISDYPVIGARFGSAFGGNGISTFGVPDERGRVPLMYDGTGTRVTVAGGAGFNGQTMGAAGGLQGVNLIAAQNGAHAHGLTQSPHNHATAASTVYGGNSIGLLGAGGVQTPINVVDLAGVLTTSTSISISVDSQGSGTVHQNMPPAQVSGIWVIKT